MINDKFPLDRNRNDAVTTALSNQYLADIILFLDADMVFPKRVIPDLLANLSDEYPSVSGLYFRKGPPHTAIQGKYVPWNKDLEMRKPTLEGMGFVDSDGNQCAFYKPMTDFTTVQPIDVAGCGVLMVKADVFKKLDLPYFGYFNPFSLGGDFSIQHLSEEMLMFAKFKKAGVKTLFVPSVRCGHISQRVIGCLEEPT